MQARFELTLEKLTVRIDESFLYISIADCARIKVALKDIGRIVGKVINEVTAKLPLGD